LLQGSLLILATGGEVLHLEHAGAIEIIDIIGYFNGNLILEHSQKMIGQRFRQWPCI
jgi:hypothetical protein